MTFRQLIQKGSYNSIFNCLHSNYYYKDSEDSITEMAVAYRRCIEELINLPPNNTNDYILIESEGNPKPTAKDLEVLLVGDETYALDLVLWSDLIDCEVQHPKGLTPSCVAAHVLYEVTFYGFRAADIKNERKRLLEVAHSLKNQK